MTAVALLLWCIIWVGVAVVVSFGLCWLVSRNT